MIMLRMIHDSISGQKVKVTSSPVGSYFICK